MVINLIARATGIEKETMEIILVKNVVPLAVLLIMEFNQKGYDKRACVFDSCDN